MRTARRQTSSRFGGAEAGPPQRLRGAVSRGRRLAPPLSQRSARRGTSLGQRRYAYLQDDPQSLHHAILEHWPSLQAARREAQLPELPRGEVHGLRRPQGGLHGRGDGVRLGGSRALDGDADGSARCTGSGSATVRELDEVRVLGDAG